MEKGNTIMPFNRSSKRVYIKKGWTMFPESLRFRGTWRGEYGGKKRIKFFGGVCLERFFLLLNYL